MIRGTTAHFRFRLQYNFSELSSAKVVFWQDYNSGPSEDRPLPIVKVLAQCTQSDNPKELCVSLTPEETLRFTEKIKAYVQMTATTIEGSRIASFKESLTVYPVYDDNVDGDDITPTPDYDGFIILDGESIQ